MVARAPLTVAHTPHPSADPASIAASPMPFTYWIPGWDMVSTELSSNGNVIPNLESSPPMLYVPVRPTAIQRGPVLSIPTLNERPGLSAGGVPERYTVFEVPASAQTNRAWSGLRHKYLGRSLPVVLVACVLFGSAPLTHAHAPKRAMARGSRQRAP
jgi:hypothetical protein